MELLDGIGVDGRELPGRECTPGVLRNFPSI